MVFFPRICSFLFARFRQLTLKGYPSFAHWSVRLTKIQNVCFCPVIEFIFSCAIQEKFTAWRVNSTSNFTWKTDIAHSSLRDSCDIGFSHEIWCAIHLSGSEFFYGICYRLLYDLKLNIVFNIGFQGRSLTKHFWANVTSILWRCIWSNTEEKTVHQWE